MESEQFDAWVRRSLGAASRRGVVRAGLGALIASALAAVGLPAGGGGEAEAKKKRKHKKKRCRGSRPVKCGANGCCPQAYPQCCDNAFPATNSRTCNPADFSCCPLDQGGGSCPAFEPQCCPPTLLEPFGFCADEDATCCATDEGGGSCPANFPVCCLFDCCEDGETCCGAGGSCPAGSTCNGGVDPEEGLCCIPDGTPRAAPRLAERGRVSRRSSSPRFHKNAR